MSTLLTVTSARDALLGEPRIRGECPVCGCSFPVRRLQCAAQECCSHQHASILHSRRRSASHALDRYWTELERGAMP